MSIPAHYHPLKYPIEPHKPLESLQDSEPFQSNTKCVASIERLSTNINLQLLEKEREIFKFYRKGEMNENGKRVSWSRVGQMW